MEEHPEARFIVERLTQAGYVAYYAGGWVRDYLLQHPSDDIDIATNASPDTIQTLFPHTVPLGLAFGIIMVIIEGKPYEVATFRQDLAYEDGRRPTGIAFTNGAEEDAKRRDFTINGMFYDPIREKVLDYVQGQADLEAKIIRAIGNPHERIREDRLRMLRAVRLACRFGFTIEKKTEEAIRAHAKELFPSVAIERVWQELEKGRSFHTLKPMLMKLQELGLLAAIFPELESLSSQEFIQRVEPLSHFPEDAPLIAYLLELFPKAPLEQRLELCAKFKVKTLDTQLATFLFRAEEMMTKSHEEVEWAHFYADKFAQLSLHILAARIPPAKLEAFLAHHQAHQEKLQFAIDRIQRKDPLIKSKDLLAHGIEPGPKMGLLLKEAERISINRDLHQKEEVLRILFNS